MNDLSVASERHAAADAVALMQDGAEAPESSAAFGALVAAARARDEGGRPTDDAAEGPTQQQAQGEGAEALSAASAAAREASDVEARGELGDGFASSLEGATTEAPAVPAFWGRPMVAYGRQGATGRSEVEPEGGAALDAEQGAASTNEGATFSATAEAPQGQEEARDAALAQRYGRSAAGALERGQDAPMDALPQASFVATDPQSPACLAQAAADAEKALGTGAAQQNDDGALSASVSPAPGGDVGGGDVASNAMFVRLGQDAEATVEEKTDDAGAPQPSVRQGADAAAETPTAGPAAQVRWNAARAFRAMGHALSGHASGRAEQAQQVDQAQAAATDQADAVDAADNVASPAGDAAAVHLAAALVGAAASLAARAGAAVGPSIAERIGHGATPVVGAQGSAPAAGGEEAAGESEEAELTATAPGQSLAELGAALSWLGAAAAPSSGDGGARALDAVRAQAMASNVGAAGGAGSASAAGGVPTQPDTEGATDAAAAASVGIGTVAGQAPAQTGMAANAAANTNAADDAENDAGATQLQGTSGAPPAAELRRPSAVGRRNAAGGTEPTSEESAAPAVTNDADTSRAAHTASVGQAAPTVPAAAARAVAAAQSIPQAEVSRELAEAVHHGSRSISLRVAPPGVGELGINVRVIAGQVRMRVAGDAPALEQALRSQLPALQQSLQERGLTLASFDVQQRDAGERDQPRNFDSFQQQSGQQNASANEEDRSYAQAAREGRGMIARAAGTAATSATAPSPASNANGAPRTLYVTV